jgi:predicted nucleic acid-binding protein
VTRYLLDTTVLVDHGNDVFGASDLVDRLFEETGDLYTCDAIVAEALSKVGDTELRVIERMIQALEYAPTSPDAARWAGAVRGQHGRSSPRRLADALVAGVAWSLGATVVTRNPRDFEGLGVVVLGYGQAAG